MSSSASGIGSIESIAILPAALKRAFAVHVLYQGVPLFGATTLVSGQTWSTPKTREASRKNPLSCGSVQGVHEIFVPGIPGLKSETWGTLRAFPAERDHGFDEYGLKSLRENRRRNVDVCEFWVVGNPGELRSHGTGEGSLCAFFEERHMMFSNAPNVYRKPEVA
jgi:hypothetical protein